MAAYCQVHGLGRLRSDCRGPGSAREPYARFEYGSTFTFTLWLRKWHLLSRKSYSCSDLCLYKMNNKT